eukprot:817726-Pyramimonas_sp.AAC.1
MSIPPFDRTCAPDPHTAPAILVSKDGQYVGWKKKYAYYTTYRMTYYTIIRRIIRIIRRIIRSVLYVVLVLANLACERHATPRLAITAGVQGSRGNV